MKSPIVVGLLVLFAVLMPIAAIASDEEGSKGSMKITLEDAVGLLSTVKPGADTDRLVAALTKQGDKAVAEIERQAADRTVDSGWGHDAVVVLKQINSAQSRSLLRKIALGKASPTNEQWAARALISCDRGEAWALLPSTDPYAISVALNAINGQPVEEKYMPVLKKLLDNRSLSVSLRAAEVMAAGTSGTLAQDAVAAIGKAMVAVPTLPGVDAPDPRVPGSTLTLGEEYYSRYGRALQRARVDNQALQALAKQLPGRSRDAVILALARRGDESVHGEIVRLAGDPQAGMFRAWAATVLGEIGTKDDLPLLRKLAENDPLVRNGPLPPPNLVIDGRGPTYPVRHAAKAAVLAIEARENKPVKK